MQSETVLMLSQPPITSIHFVLKVEIDAPWLYHFPPLLIERMIENSGASILLGTKEMDRVFFTIISSDMILETLIRKDGLQTQHIRKKSLILDEHLWKDLPWPSATILSQFSIPPFSDDLINPYTVLLKLLCCTIKRVERSLEKGSLTQLAYRCGTPEYRKQITEILSKLQERLTDIG